MSNYPSQGRDGRDGAHRTYHSGGRGYGQRGGGNYGRGWKRKREDNQFDEGRYLLKSLITLGDRKGQGEAPIELQIEDLARTLRRDLNSRPQQLQRVLLDCVIQLGYKVPYYSVLIGLLNVEEQDFVRDLISQAGNDFNAALEQGDVTTARLLLRFFASLVVANVVYPSSMLSALCDVITAVNSIAHSDVAEGQAGLWQYYTDHVVHAVLIALPWGGSDLAESASNEFERLFSLVGEYFEARHRPNQPGLCIFFEGIKEDDPAASSDCGTASAAALTWQASQQCRDEHLWDELSIPNCHAAFEAQLATGMAHELPALRVPTSVPGVPPDLPPAEQAAQLVLTYPPRGVVHLLAAEHTTGERPLMSRIITEDYALDILTSFQGDRLECARRLATALPIPWKYESLLAEIMFCQLLRVPSSQYVPLAYSTIMVDLCKLMQTFPRSMSACVRECFARVGVMDPDLRSRLAVWLAYHLSNFEYVWPWEKWKHVLDAPMWDGQRRFVVSVLSRLIRLSYWDRVAGIIPESFHVLLPPKPEPQPLTPPQPESTDGTMEPIEVQPEAKWAAELVGLIRERTMADGILAWLQESGVTEDLGAPLAVLRMMFRGMLVAGAKSFTHMIIVMERYISILQQYVAEIGMQAEVALIDVASQVWVSSPQRAAMAADRLLALRIVSGEAVIEWVFESPGMRSVCDEILAGTSWEIFYNALDKLLARTQDAQIEVKAAQQALQAAQEAAEEATAKAKAAAAPQNGDEQDAEMENGSAVIEDTAAVTVTQEAIKEAEEQLEQRNAYLQEALGHQSGVILTAAQSFASLLSQETVELSDDLDDEEQLEAARKAWYDYTLAGLKGFLRKYNQAVTIVADSIQNEIFREDAVPADVREAVVASFFL